MHCSEVCLCVGVRAEVCSNQQGFHHPLATPQPPPPQSPGLAVLCLLSIKCLVATSSLLPPPVPFATLLCGMTLIFAVIDFQLISCISWECLRFYAFSLPLTMTGFPAGKAILGISK